MTKDSWDAEALRRRLNAYPPYAGAGIEVTHLADEAHRRPLLWSMVVSQLHGTHRGRAFKLC